MKQKNRKGFTIVELVIVIAVIAILAAVLIPTFSSLIAKANLSNDQQVVRILNTTLAYGGATETPENMQDAVDILTTEGYQLQVHEAALAGARVCLGTDQKSDSAAER